MKKNDAGILGYGEIGKAIAKFYKNPLIKDLKRDDGLKSVEILHVCIPWSNKFLNIVIKEIKEVKPQLTIIHSTIPLGTTKKIIAGLPVCFKNVVHSPVRGVHPHLYEGIKTFVKYIGADSKKAALMAKEHLEGLGIKTKILIPSLSSEALKLWDTTQYGWMIVLSKEIKKWCDENKMKFEDVYIDANKTYNEGYWELSRKEVLRPYLKYVSGKIGGHCIMPNCLLLKSDVSKFIVKKNKSY